MPLSHSASFRVQMGCRSRQRGYVLVSVLIIVFFVAVTSNSMIDLSEQAGKVSAASIQRDRVFQSIDSALRTGEQFLLDNAGSQIFHDASGSEVVFKRGVRADRWWTQADDTGQLAVDENLVLGVSQPPRYTVEEIGRYLHDGGTGIVTLGAGSGTYGSVGDGAREVVLYSLEAYGKGSVEDIQAAAESTFVLSR